jgi:transglutaminase-like putative cysteine protease
LLSYTSTSADPGYLQVYVLGDLTGRGWQFSRPQSLVPAGTTVPAPPGLAAGAARKLVTTNAAVSNQSVQDPFGALPAPYPPVRVNADGTVQTDRSTLMLFDSGTQLAGLNYSVTSLDVNPSEEALKKAGPPPKDIADRYLDVPQSYAPLRTLATSITASATTRYAKAVALQDWFSDGNFGYSLSAPTITNAAGLENFVNNTHAGYCQQFSFAMAVLARLLGIPSRVVYGFTQGTRQHDGSWLVTTHDAHAWPELYFQGYGWLRFEPTPAGANGQGTATTPAYTAPQAGPVTPSSSAPRPNPAGTLGGTTGSGANQSALNRGHHFPDDGSGGTALPVPPPGGPNPWQLAGLSALGLLVVAAALPGCARTAIRRRRWRRAGALAAKALAGTVPSEAAHADRARADRARADTGRALTDRALADAAWRELRDDLTDHHAGYLPSESPRALADRVTEELELSPDAADALRRVTMAAERAFYSARPASGVTLRDDSGTVRRAVAASVPRRTRWLARVFPSSVVTPVVFTFGQVTDVFGRLGFSRVKIGANRLRGRTAA